MKQLKYIILFLAYVLSVSTVCAQDRNVDWQKQLTTAGWEFAPIGAKWYYDVGDGIETMECVKDTVIGGQIMRKITDIYRRDFNTIIYRESFFVCSKEDTAYVYNPETKELDRLYVFNAEAGDTLTLDVPYYSFNYYESDLTFRLYIRDVTVKDMNGVPVRYYHYEPLDGFTYDLYRFEYYDYAGGMKVFFPQLGFHLADEKLLQCYSDATVGELKFKEDCECGTYPWSIENTMQNPNEVQVFYSSDERQLFVQSAAGKGACRTALFTDEGTKVMEFAGETADLSALSAGIYLVQVESLKGKEVLFKGKIQVK